MPEEGISIVAGKNLALIGFDKLEHVELKTIKEVMAGYIRRLERVSYQELKVRLKLHQHAKSFIHELEAELYMHGTTLNAKMMHKNLYKALALTMKKLLKEIEHLEKKSLRKKPIRKLSRKI